MDLLTSDTTIFLQIILALFLGMLLGTERTFAGRTAGMRTYALVSMGSCLLVVISQVVAKQYLGMSAFDPLRMSAGVVMGIGFLGAGIIFHNNETTTGLTTAAGIWVTSAIGIAIGYGLYDIAVFVTLITLVTFSVLWLLEKEVKIASKKLHNKPADFE